MKKKKVFVFANTKGGVGKSTIAWHLMPTLFPGCSVLEIDKHNVSDVYTRSKLIERRESITLSECATRLEEISFELLDSSHAGVLVIDCGGGDDTITVLKQVKELALDELADVTYIVPVMNSLSQAKNAVDMSIYLAGKRVVFALNNIADFQKIQKDWVFWYGNEYLGIESYSAKLEDPECIYVPASPLFELAALYNVTIGDFAKPAEEISMSEYQKAVFEENKDDKPKYISLLQKFRRNVEAKQFLDSFVPSVRDILK